ncbi:protein-glutamate O-methyltransferase CheR [Campylobacter sp. faydin G-140]|uniref:CheR family methyltransferase n=1 Tax=Campylobacter anatolicus TaxID=2829105 RepID=UPI001B96E5E1|nr:CheR family methyltransferase [Campylobacter anatolicus]MBR8464935.1 protein-glutamate O-methyltransferase CheR [Campylobacter anatolicus]
MLFRKNNTEEQVQESAPQVPTDKDGFDEFMDTIRVVCGVDLEPKRDITLQRLGAFARDRRIKKFKELAQIIRYNNDTRQDILNLVTVNETYFYRELPQLKDAVSYAKDLGAVRILCAPCSSGDEVYSLAMLAYESGMNLANLSIVGIDINSQAIASCKNAVYNERSLHRLDAYQKERFFTKDGDKFIIKKHMFPHCEFKILNVFDDAIFSLGKFDIILSRNMMIYFDDEFRLKCVERLHKLLKDYGRLYTGHADIVPYTDLYTKQFSLSTSYYAKA